MSITHFRVDRRLSGRPTRPCRPTTRMSTGDSRIDRQIPCRRSATLMLTENDRDERHPSVDGFRVYRRLAY